MRYKAPFKAFENSSVISKRSMLEIRNNTYLLRTKQSLRS